MKRLTTMLALAAMMSSLTGCCCWWPWYGNNGGGACGPAGCAPGYGAPAYAPQGTTSYQTYDAVTGLPLSTTTAYQPAIVAPAVSLGPLEALPTYR
ncbi:MAG: hypothetical protein DWI21_00060 [Planctomycetota bacterium]|nr:MAG: hypothetical protein DWI21_00060 [Planctomycetota bacterium]GDY09352.1 hypothetical protein LBMAG52_28380 [Planctomycetia bacterium]